MKAARWLAFGIGIAACHIGAVELKRLEHLHSPPSLWLFEPDSRVLFCLAWPVAVLAGLELFGSGLAGYRARSELSVPRGRETMSAVIRTEYLDRLPAILFGGALLSALSLPWSVMRGRSSIEWSLLMFYFWTLAAPILLPLVMPARRWGFVLVGSHGISLRWLDGLKRDIAHRDVMLVRTSRGGEVVVVTRTPPDRVNRRMYARAAEAEAIRDYFGLTGSTQTRTGLADDR